MKKVIALVLALAVAICALSVTAFAADEKVVFDNADGIVPASCDEGPWGSFGIVGTTMGRADCCDITVEDLVALFAEGGWTFTFVYSGTPNNFGTATNPDANPQFVVNGDWDHGVQTTHVELGDGKYQATIALDDILASYSVAAGDVTQACVQIYTSDFKLYSAKFTKGESADETTPADTTPADTTPADTTPADTTPADTTPADTTPADATPAPSTGLALAVVPAIIALGAVAVSKKH